MEYPNPALGSNSWLSLAGTAFLASAFAFCFAYWLQKRSFDCLLLRLRPAGLADPDLNPNPAVAAEKKSSSDSSPRSFGPARSFQELASPGKKEKAAFRSLSHRSAFGGTGLPPGLPRAPSSRKLGVGKSFNLSMRAGSSILRSAPPISPVNENIEGSDEEDMLMEKYNLPLNGGENIASVQTDISLARKEIDFKMVSPPNNNPVEVAQGNGEELQKSQSILNRSHSMAADILRKVPEEESFVRLEISPMELPDEEEEDVCLMIQECLDLRKKYVFRENITPWEKEEITDPTDPSTLKPNPDPFHYEPEQASKIYKLSSLGELVEGTRSLSLGSLSLTLSNNDNQHIFKMQDGVVHVYADSEADKELFPIISATEFFTDLHHIQKIISLGDVRTFCHNRLRLLEQKFSLHLMLNEDRELLAQKSAPHRDFYNVRKVDTHIHHSACMNQKHLVRFIKSKLRNEPDEVVIFRDGKHLTLREVFESLDLTGYDLNVDLLDVHADKSTFHRFDKFNLKYNPFGQSRLREIFLKQENFIQGRFLAELTKEVFSDLAASKFQMAEYRISIYGRKQSEWDNLAKWFVNHNLHSEHVVWLIQLPRLYNIYKEAGIVKSFQTMLDNIFIPLFEVTVDPGSHPELHMYLKQVVGFDLVDDESKPERRPRKHMPTPSDWDVVFNPAYSYYAYYVYANLYVLNKLRESKGMTTIKLRPHSGEAGELDHLAATFLVAHNISHGVNLRKSPALQYLYYLAQIGLAMSPLSNNSLFLDYHRNPFPMFFARGLNVSLSTDDPLQIHLTKEPLVEEYAIAAQVWKFSSCDLCEIARNSVYQSGFSHALKSRWLGNTYYKRGSEGNNTRKTNVPHMRVEFRNEVWKDELQYLYLGNSPISDEIDP